MRPTNPLFRLLLAAALIAPGGGVLLAQESKAVLHAPMAVLPVDSAPFQKLADFDGDGDLDAVGTRIYGNGNGNQIYVWRNDGGTFTTTQIFAASEGTGPGVGANVFPIDVADFNGDGLMDFVVVGESRAIRYFAQPGFQFVAQPPLWLVNANLGRRAVATGDFDHDGQVDIAVAANGFASDHLFVFAGNGAWTSIQISVDSQPRLHALELDGVPGDDLLVSGLGQLHAEVFTLTNNQIQHVQTLSSSLNYAGPTPWLWMGGDLDNDNDIDVIVFKPEPAPGAAKYQIFRRTAAGTLVPESIAFGGPAEYLYDIDGDGDLDGACCGGGGPGFAWHTLDFKSTFELATNRGGGDFAPSFSFPGAGSKSLAGVADLDADGDVELVAGRCVFYGNGPWDEQPMPLAGGAQVSGSARAADVHDIDRDGDLDYYGVVNRGDGWFQTAPPLPAPPAGFSYMTEGLGCDVDGDGVRDRLMSLQQNASGTFAGMAWLRNNGGGHMLYEGAVAPAGVPFGNVWGINPHDHVVADFDGDGYDDVYANNNATVYFNQNGTFGGSSYALPVYGIVLCVTDFNGDGINDVVLRTGTWVHVLRGTNTPGAWFVPEWTAASFFLPTAPAGTAFGDVNDDGRIDFVTPWWNLQPRVFINQTLPGQPMSFTGHDPGGPELSVVAAATEPSMSLADFNGDGATDIFIGHIRGEPNVSAVMLRQSTSPTNLTYETVYFAIPDGFAADVDLDGDPDVVGEYTARNRLLDRHVGGSRVQVHDGVQGEVGATPVLGGSGPYTTGGSHTLRLTNVPGPTVAIVGVSLFEAALPNSPLPGMTMRLDPGAMIVGTLPITDDGQGRAAAMATLSLPIFPGMEGWHYYVQAFVQDGAAAQGFSQSNLLSLRVGL
tara:strand:+ start:1858 stop:4518 length:2661 start_codon:yes stop_codon:yes gene_type:complete